MLRRIVLLLIIFIVLLQASWAAVGAICTHETGKAAQHFGHHDHQHQSSDADKSGGKGKVDPDCAFHNHANLQGITSELPLLPVLPVGSAKVAADVQLHLLTVFDRPDRPKWVAAFSAAS